MRKRFALLGLAAALFAWGCGDDDGDTTTDDMGMVGDMGDPGDDMGTPPGDDMFVPPNTIVDVAAADDRFEILVAALERVELDDALRGTGPFTVFAPTDDAFETLLTELEVESLDDIDDATLTLYLQNHVLVGEVLAADIPSDPPIADNLADLTLWFDTSDGVTVNEATVTEADITAPSNGVIHVVDDVIDPATIPSMAGIAGLDELAAALVEATLVETVSMDGPFTVFAPTDAAFEALYTELSVADATEIDDATLEAVLLYHVLAAAVESGEIPSGVSTATTASPGPVTDGPGLSVVIDNGGSITINGATVVIADIKVTNGVIHVIDEVILPPDIPTMAGIAGLDSLVGALTEAGLEGATAAGATGEPFTVFAPTNDAFAALLSDLGAADVAAVDDALLEATLLYHVVGSVIESGDVPNPGPAVVSTLSPGPVTDGPTLTVLASSDGTDVTVNDATVVIADIVTTSGIVHVIDTVMVPPDIPAMATIAGLSDLVTALGDNDLVAPLQADGPFTVFAPTNTAFAAADLTGADVPNTLLYHVTGLGAVAAGDLVEGLQVVPTLADPDYTDSDTAVDDKMTLLVTRTGADVTANVANVVIADVVTTNGIVHVVDAVITRPNVAEMADLAGLSELLAAVAAAPDLAGGTSVADALATTPNLTVFAPANGAGLASAGLTGTDLRDTLLYHVVPASDLMASELPTGVTAAGTVEGSTLAVTRTATDVTVLGEGNTTPANVAIPDVVSTNGVVHVIDDVLELLLP